MQVLVEAETSDGARHSILLQNAETVKLVGPAAQSSSPAASQPQASSSGSATAGTEADQKLAGGNGLAADAATLARMTPAEALAAFDSHPSVGQVQAAHAVPTGAEAGRCPGQGLSLGRCVTVNAIAALDYPMPAVVAAGAI